MVAGIERESLTERVSDASGLGSYCNRWEQARSRLTRILEQDPNQVGAWFSRGRFDLRLGRVEDALAGFDEAVRIDAQHPRGHIDRARVRAVQADCDGALEDLKKARELVPERLDSWADEAWIHTAILFHTCPDSYDGPAALDLARKVVAVNPRNWRYQLPLGMALYRHRRFEEALAAIEVALEIDTEPLNEPLRLFPLALAQWKLGRREDARATYDLAAAEMNEISPRFPVFVLLQNEADRALGIDPSR
jgi:tetratricopeptide (TPR) repeat protein